METPDITRLILKAYGYTPTTLAADLDVSREVAKRILNGPGEMGMQDIELIAKHLHVPPIFISGWQTPGTVAAQRKRAKLC